MYETELAIIRIDFEVSQGEHPVNPVDEFHDHVELIRWNYEGWNQTDSENRSIAGVKYQLNGSGREFKL